MAQKSTNIVTLKEQIKVLESKIIDLKASLTSNTSPAKECHACGRVTSIENFTRSIASKDGHTNTCKKCTAAQSKLRYITKKYGRL